MKRVLCRESLCVCMALFMLAIAAVSYAQVASTGAISGTVTDSTGAFIPGAAVVVTNQATGVSHTVTTDSAGFYSAESIPVGTYSVNISKAGFQQNFVLGMHIDPGVRRANNVKLQVGSTASQITVRANAVQVNTQTSESSGTITSEQVSNLMLNGRNFQTLAIMVPGVASVNGANQQIGGGVGGQTALVINGQGIQNQSYNIDGAYDEGGNGMGVYVLPIVDGIEEFRVLKANYSARYGIGGASQIMVETKSGTNTYHGSAWDYLRNNAFDAKNYFSTSTSKLHQNIFGFTLGGPVIIPGLYNTKRDKKSFFFASNQWILVSAGQVIRAALPTEAMRNGDFSASPTLSGPFVLDAHSQGLLSSDGRTNCISGPKTLNPACFDPVAVAVMNAYWPLPNNLSGGFNNYLNQGNKTTNQGDSQYRLDQAIGSKNELMAHFMYEPVDQRFPDGLGLSLNPTPRIPEIEYTTGLNDMIRLTTFFSPNVVNNVGVAEIYTKVKLIETAPMPSGVSIIQAFPGADPLNRIPNISLSRGWAGNGTSGLPIEANDGEGSIFDDASWVKGSHVLQAGFVYISGVKHQDAFSNPAGSFSFSGVHTGDPVADYLLGLNATYSQVNRQRRVPGHYNQTEAYVQDDWRASPRLSLNLGLRWAYMSSDTASDNQVASFSPALYKPAEAPVVNVNGSLVINSSNIPLDSSGQPANLLNGIIFAGKNGVPRGFYTPVKTNFAPRVGFAYDVSGNGTTSIRGGYGVGYSRRVLSQLNAAYGQNPPYVKSANVLNSLLSNGTVGTPKAPTTQTLSIIQPSYTPVQVQTYSLTVEHQLAPSTVAHVAYVGSLGRHLSASGFDVNSALPVTTPSAPNCLGSGQQASASYDFDPCINAGSASQDHTRPYQGYSKMNSEFDGGSSNYNSLQTGLIYRTSRAQVNLSYTYSKTLGTINPHSGGNTYGSTVQNPRNVAAEYGPLDFDFTHVFTGTWVYNVPLFEHSSRPVAAALGHWTFAGLGLLQSGSALTPGLATSHAGIATHPDQVAPIHKIGKLNEWFSTNSFAAPKYGFFGNASNGTIRGPGQISFNVALYKTFPITTRLNMQFRAEAFNVMNHPNFGGPSTSVGSGSYGQITSAADPRIMEFALKLTY
ncbi:MAG: carboxypeptidase regulatory-like domain-containing protein [Acidobacteriaceae bacterium]